MPCVIPYCPRPLQWRFHEERTRFCVLLCHRRFGKTVAAVNDLIREALRRGRGGPPMPRLSWARPRPWPGITANISPEPCRARVFWKAS